jgi:hypothetical protein
VFDRSGSLKKHRSFNLKANRCTYRSTETRINEPCINAVAFLTGYSNIFNFCEGEIEDEELIQSEKIL